MNNCSYINNNIFISNYQDIFSNFLFLNKEKKACVIIFRVLKTRKSFIFAILIHFSFTCRLNNKMVVSVVYYSLL